MNNEANPWVTRGTKQVYKNKWITVREDDVLTPAGKPGIYGVVETLGCCGVIALTEQNEVVMVGQYRYPTRIYSWEIIEGGKEPGEDFLAAAKRELREEAGYEAEHWEELGGKIQLSNCHSDEVGKIFLATGLTKVTATPEETEVLTVRKVPLDKAIEMALTGEVEDGLTLIGLLHMANKRR
jgi:8-oxo-dGTP pyrophosphatase MutT (NUDIX family)